MDFIESATEGDMAITLNADDGPQGLNGNQKNGEHYTGKERLIKATEYYSRILMLYFKPYYDYGLVLELSEPESNECNKQCRIHAHGVLKLKKGVSEFEFRLNEWHKLKGCQIKVKRIEKADKKTGYEGSKGWISYCKKQDHFRTYVEGLGIKSTYSSKDAMIYKYRDPQEKKISYTSTGNDIFKACVLDDVNTE